MTCHLLEIKHLLQAGQLYLWAASYVSFHSQFWKISHAGWVETVENWNLLSKASLLLMLKFKTAWVSVWVTKKLLLQKLVKCMLLYLTTHIRHPSWWFLNSGSDLKMRICCCLEALSDAFKCFSKLLKGFQNITCLKSDKVWVLNDIHNTYYWQILTRKIHQSKECIVCIGRWLCNIFCLGVSPVF